MVKAAGLPRVPIDPYSGQPLRMAIIDGEPVIYSVGKDGRDDGGRIDSDSTGSPATRPSGCRRSRSGSPERVGRALRSPTEWRTTHMRLISRASARSCVAAIALAIATTITSIPAGAFQARRGPSPACPAQTRPPDGIGPGAPFDVAALFTAPHTDLNAAPLYLDALFEFGPEPAVCFPEGAETTQRKQVAERRSRAIDDLFSEFGKDPASVSNQAMDGLVAELEPALARSRTPRPAAMRVRSSLGYVCPTAPCEPGAEGCPLGGDEDRRCLDRGEVDQPLHDLEVVLRLTRDLRPRGSLICQIIATSIGEIAMSEIIPALWPAPRCATSTRDG